MAKAWKLLGGLANNYRWADSPFDSGNWDNFEFYDGKLSEEEIENLTNRIVVECSNSFEARAERARKLLPRDLPGVLLGDGED